MWLLTVVDDDTVSTNSITEDDVDGDGDANVDHDYDVDDDDDISGRLRRPTCLLWRGRRLWNHSWTEL